MAIAGHLRRAICAAALVFAVLPVGEALSQSLPTIDLKTRCRNSERAAIDMMGDKTLQGRAFDTCMQAEEEARQALLKSWPDVPAAYKSFCVQSRQYSPSYIEWIACLEMMIDIKKLRSNVDVNAVQPVRRCPVLQYSGDGSIIGVRACGL
jgi:hypothetical protein